MRISDEEYMKEAAEKMKADKAPDENNNFISEEEYINKLEEKWIEEWHEETKMAKMIRPEYRNFDEGDPPEETENNFIAEEEIKGIKGFDSLKDKSAKDINVAFKTYTDEIKEEWEKDIEKSRQELIDKEDEYESILDEAKDITQGQESRNRNYRHPKHNFKKIARMWNAYLINKRESGYDHNDDDDDIFINKKDVAMMMALLKIVREQEYHKRDNLVDAAGYINTAAIVQYSIELDPPRHTGGY